MKRLFLIDAYALVFKYYYAFMGRPMRNRAGMNTSIVYGFTKFLRDIQKREKPDLLGVALDPKGGSFRCQLFPEYKANRPATPEDIINIQNEVKKVFVHENLEKYIVSIVSATRNHPSVRLGASPRASLALYRTAQATAYINGRDFVIPDDIQKMVIPVMAHRIILSQETKFSNTTADDVLNEIKKAVPVPSGK